MKALLLVAVVAALTGAAAQSCPGVCQDSNSLDCPSGYESGLCPGASNFQCCPEPTPGCNGQCQDTSLPCSGTYSTGDCPGPFNIQCCQSGGPTPPSNTAQGVDVAVPIDYPTAQCMASQGYSNAVTRAWHSTGAFDSDAPGNLQNFQAAGLSTDVYMFPCVGQDPTQQVNSMISSLQSAGVSWNITWVDVEENPSGGCDWDPSNFDNNCQYLTTLVSAISSAGATPGVYSSASVWNTYFGGSSSCPDPAFGGAVPLWYARYDGDNACDDFIPFSGWTSPLWHQWAGDSSVCGQDVDLNVACQ